MSKTRGFPEVLVELCECPQLQGVGSMIQPLLNSGFLSLFWRRERDVFRHVAALILNEANPKQL